MLNEQSSISSIDGNLFLNKPLHLLNKCLRLEELASVWHEIDHASLAAALMQALNHILYVAKA